jgi:phage tail-like protein
MQGEYYPPVGFYFVVGFNSPDSDIDGKFQEVSGISNEMGSESVTEGGESRFQWQLPTVSKPSNLVLKRGVLTKKSALANWVNETLSSGFQEPIKPKIINVSLLGAEKKILIQWVFQNARPTKWQFSNLDSMKNEILTESIEFAYNYYEVKYFSEELDLGK